MHDAVHHPQHYVSHESGVEVIEFTRLLPFGPGSAVKYVMRRDLKNDPVENLSKAIWYLTDSIDQRIAVPITHRMQHVIGPVIDAEPNATVKQFLAAVYLPHPNDRSWLFTACSDLTLARALCVALLREYAHTDEMLF